MEEPSDPDPFGYSADDESPPYLEHEVEEQEQEETCGGEGGNNFSSTATLKFDNPSSGGLFDDPVFRIYKEEAAPTDFQVLTSDSEDENFDQLLSASPPNFDAAKNMEKFCCPLCKRKRQRITCLPCLRAGDFTAQASSNGTNGWGGSRPKERYSVLMSKWQTEQHKLADLKAKSSPYVDKMKRCGLIVDEIEKLQQTIIVQQQLKAIIQAKIANACKESQELRVKAEDKERMWPVLRNGLDNMKKVYFGNYKKLGRSHEKVRKSQSLLKSGTKSRIVQLRHHVFPIDEAGTGSRIGSKGDQSFNESFEEDDTVRSLMAMQMQSNYWSRPDELVSSFGTCYTITGMLGPTLPATGDYSAYNMWADRNQNPTAGVIPGKGTGSSHRNPAHCIAASLTYTTQFVNLIAYYLDLRLPHRLSYSEFRNGDLSAEKFNKKVAKLNANVIHLCASQGVSPDSLHPRKTIPNILLLFDQSKADLGRRGPFEVVSRLAKSMEDSFEKDLLVILDDGSPESDLDWNDASFPSDWETISRATICEEIGISEMRIADAMSSPLSPTSPSLFMSTSSSPLSGAGLFTSITSMFNRWR